MYWSTIQVRAVFFALFGKKAWLFPTNRHTRVQQLWLLNIKVQLALIGSTTLFENFLRVYNSARRNNGELPLLLLYENLRKGLTSRRIRGHFDAFNRNWVAPDHFLVGCILNLLDAIFHSLTQKKANYLQITYIIVRFLRLIVCRNVLHSIWKDKKWKRALSQIISRFLSDDSGARTVCGNWTERQPNFKKVPTVGNDFQNIVSLLHYLAVSFVSETEREKYHDTLTKPVVNTLSLPRSFT